MPTLRACPRCCAAARPGAPWCTQCFHVLGEPAELERVQPEQVPPEQVPPEQAAPEGAPRDGRVWPCTSCGTRNALDDGACASCGAGFLADLRTADTPLLVLPGVGDVGRFGRVRLIVAAVVFVLLAVLLMVLGAYLLV